MDIKTGADFRKAIKQGAYAWPGGYPIYFIVDDGEALSFKDAKDNAKQIISAIRSKDRGGWRVVASDINWEDENLYSAHSGDKIESAYGENPKKRTRPRANTPDIHIDVNSHNQREAGAYMKNPARARMKPFYDEERASIKRATTPYAQDDINRFNKKMAALRNKRKQIKANEYVPHYNVQKKLHTRKEWSNLASFPYTPEGKKHAIQYASAYKRLHPNYDLSVR